MIKVIPQSQYQQQPWKNGTGTTWEIARFPHEGDDYLCRLSMAEVKSSGPFSLFPGMSRTLVQLSGKPMVISHQNKIHPLTIHHPYDFEGEWETSCKISEPCRDFNIIYKRDKVRSHVHLAQLKSGEIQIFNHLGDKMVFFCLQGELRLPSIGLKLQQYDTLLVDSVGTLHLIGQQALTKYLLIDLNGV